MMLRLLVGSGVTLLFLVAAVGAVPHRTRPGAPTYIGLAVALALLAATIATEHAGILAGTQTLAVFVAGWMVAAVLWALFSFSYTGRGPTVTWGRSVSLLGMSLATAIVVLWVDQQEAGNDALALAVSPLLLVILSLSVFGVFLVARAGIGYDDLPLGQSLALTGAGSGVTVLWLVGNLGDIVGTQTTLDIVLATLGVTGGSFLLAQVRYQLFEAGPGTGYLARETVLDQMSECVLLVDRESQLMDFNWAAERTFGVTKSEGLGRQVSDVLGRRPVDGELVTLDTRAGRRQFAVTQSQLHNRRDEQLGQVYLLRDVTEQRTHEQRLDVLNRVLRHNLRNEFDAIRGFAEALQEEPQPEERTVFADRIHETSQNLVEMGSTVARVERLLARKTLDHATVDVSALLTASCERVGDTFPAGAVTVSGPDSVDLQTDRQLLETIVEELLVNALEHNDRENPTVEVVVEPVATGVQISVQDDGPGIPTQERSVLLDGEETPLRHGSGLGLWMVYWSVIRLGGTLSFSTNEPRGSVVTLRLPHLDAEPGSGVGPAAENRSDSQTNTTDR